MAQGYKSTNTILSYRKDGPIIGYMEDPDLCEKKSDFIRDAIREYWANHPELEAAYRAKHPEDTSPPVPASSPRNQIIAQRREQCATLGAEKVNAAPLLPPTISKAEDNADKQAKMLAAMRGL